MNNNTGRTIAFVPHYLSVDVYADLAIEIAQYSEYKAQLLVLSESDKETALNKGVPLATATSYENCFLQGRLDNFGLDELAERFPDVSWGTIIAAERAFTDYSFTFGGIGGRSERNSHIVPFLLRLIAFFDCEFDRIKPLAVVTVFGDNIFTHTAAVVAEQKGIPFILPHASYMNENGRLECGYLANTRFLESFEMVRNYLDYRSRDLTEAERQRAEKFAKTLRGYDGSKTLEQIHKKKAFEKPITPNIKRIIGYVKQNKLLDSQIHFYKIDVWKKIKANLIRLVRFRATNLFLSKQPATLPDNIILFPMHFQPEASTLVNGIWYANQVSLIENLSKALPLGYTLIVKEHPRGRGVRPLWQYHHIASLFNVQFSELPSKVILEHAEAVVTISGSIGLEALAMRKPVIILGRTFHSFNTLYFRADSMEELAYVLRRVLLDKAFDSIHNLEDEIHKSLLAYISSLYDFFPFGENRKSLTRVILEELGKPTDEARKWIAALSSSPERPAPIKK